MGSERAEQLCCVSGVNAQDSIAVSRPPVEDSEGTATEMRSMCVLSTFQNHCDSSEMCASVVCVLCLEGMNHNCWPEKLLTVYSQGLRESQRNFSRPLISWDLFIFKKIVFLALCSRSDTFPPEHGGFTGAEDGLPFCTSFPSFRAQLLLFMQNGSLSRRGTDVVILSGHLRVSKRNPG